MIQYRILETGCFYADGGAMFGAIPKRAWSRRYPSDEQNRCRLAMNCMLVWNQERIVLLDTGVGKKDLKNLSYYDFHNQEDLVELIGSHGFKPEQITDVVLSHLHFDHCGGCTYTDDNGNLQLTFPKAKYWVSKPQWEEYMNPNDLEKDSFRPADMLPVLESGSLRLVNDNFTLFDGFTIKLYDGHTKGQIVSFIETEDEYCLFPGDVFPTKAHLSDEWISAYDIEPLESLATKRKIKELISDKKYSIIFYHDSNQLKL